jgi:integrase
MIRKIASGWLVDIQPEGRGGKRYRKTLKTKAEALRWEAWLIAKVTKTPDWEPPKKDQRRLSDLLEIWYEGHGKQLRDAVHRQKILKNAISRLENPKASNFSAAHFIGYRSQRLAEGIKEATANREHAYLRSLFNELKRLGHWQGENPLQAVRQFKERQQELIYLKSEQIQELLDKLEGDAKTVSMICLATGARWSEAEHLRAEQVENALITFTDTKSGKNRSVPISTNLSHTIKTRASGRLFKPCYEAFRRATKNLSFDLPKGQLTHVLRHTFASHFVMNGGNIIVLQRILGHQSLAMTMRYAHFAPDHLQQATALNPLNDVDNPLTPSNKK